ncbi:DUF1501 domain-containing protein [Tautonia sociabilis]|uniref:DUF1501 domain-containing protein n=1 Tax=Tautonia sociabilis TaxID=2080755 RepID=A0A432MH48_9BACT|nr:DUF1501 domain-containing protein [Tautonia sociabilis]RUL86307.1 DUF1501 domain-containing protein [Tautonia sociabilis]
MDLKSIVRVDLDGAGALRRRGFLKTVGLGMGAAGLSFTDRMAVHAASMRSRHRAMILLWMNGGPSQFETFDPKPEHPNGGGTRAIETSVPGIRIAEGWSRVAGVMEDIALIRSMTNTEGNHQRATYQLHTGYAPTASVKHPSFGASAARELADASFDLPHLVQIGGRGAMPGSGAGFLGTAFEPFHVDDPSQPPANAEPAVPRDRFSRRLGLLSGLERAGFGASAGADVVAQHQELYRQSSGMVLSPRMEAFDLGQEPEALRDSYGRNPFGQGCLLARRLVETGVTFVEVRSPGNWDTHVDQADRLAELIPPVDQGFAALIADLKDRGMLDSTLVVWMGEFGRSPTINPNAGRDHFPRAFSVALAGGGVRGGQVIGGTSPDGTDIAGSPVTVPNLLASFCQALGIDPTIEHMSPIGRPLKIADGGIPVKELFS